MLSNFLILNRRSCHDKFSEPASGSQSAFRRANCSTNFYLSLMPPAHETQRGSGGSPYVVAILLRLSHVPHLDEFPLRRLPSVFREVFDLEVQLAFVSPPRFYSFRQPAREATRIHTLDAVPHDLPRALRRSSSLPLCGQRRCGKERQRRGRQLSRVFISLW